jgi:hypothetical protein
MFKSQNWISNNELPFQYDIKKLGKIVAVLLKTLFRISDIFVLIRMRIRIPISY